MTFNQNFIPTWNSIYTNLLTKVYKTIISSNLYASPFSAMLQNMETGQYVEDIHINPSHMLLQDTIINSDLFTDYTDDIATAIYEVEVDLVYPSTYTEYVVRTSFNIVENVAELITAITANLRTTLEYHRTNLVKQMLYNGYQYGMISSSKISDPRLNVLNSANFAVELNTTVDDFKTEINPRNIIYNNQVGLTTAQKRKTIAKENPYVIIFNNYIRGTEFNNAINLGLIERFKSGDSNQDFADRIIRLNADDFPTSIPPINRSSVTGNNVSATDINFFEMPKDANGNNLFSGTPTGGNTILAFVLEPAVLKLFTQLSITTSWLNPATVKTTNREIYRGIMQLGAFNKIKAITCDAGV